MKTLKELKSLKTVRVNRKNPIGIENWPDTVSRLVSEVELLNKEHNANITYKETDDKLEFSNGQFFLKPKTPLMQTGTITFRSSDYYFTDDITGSNSYGSFKADSLIKDANNNIIGWYIDMYHGSKIEYTLA